MGLSPSEILLLFDVDGTLTFPRSLIEDDFETFLYEKVKPHTTMGIVGGADLEKMFEQMNGKRILLEFDFIFPENGLVQIENGVEMGRESIQGLLGEENLHRFISYVLRYVADLQLPFKRGTFLEFRNGMMNICPCGRQCSREERGIFAEFDRKHSIRDKMITNLKKEFHDVNLTYSIGGQISFDIYPNGWDKTFCLRHVTQDRFNFKEIHFFGDKTQPGGNDYEIFNDSRTIGHKVETPHDTRRILEEMFNIK